MSRKYSFVYMRKYKIELRTLGLYERQIGELCLTAQSLKKLVEAIKNKQLGKLQAVQPSKKGRLEHNKVAHGPKSAANGQSKTKEITDQQKPGSNHHVAFTARPQKDFRPRTGTGLASSRQ